MIDLRNILKELNLSQKEFADEIGKHPSAVHRVIRGDLKMPKEWGVYLSDKYNIDLGDYTLEVDNSANDESIKNALVSAKIEVFVFIISTLQS